VTGLLLIGAAAATGFEPAVADAVWPAVTVRASVDSTGIEAIGASTRGALSRDGRYVLFTSSASNLVPGDTNDVDDVFVHDAWTGATVRVSVDDAGIQGNAGSIASNISGDGRYVGFLSRATDLDPRDTSNTQDAYIHDRDSDEDGIFDEPGATSTQVVSVDDGGNPGNADTWSADISDDGRFASFYSVASNLVTGDANAAADVFVRDLTAGTTRLVSRHTDGTQGNAASNIGFISDDGRWVVMHAGADNLVDGDTNGASDVFVVDRSTGAMIRVSVAADGGQGNADGFIGHISTDGRYIAFESAADNLVGDDTNGAIDAFLHDRDTDEDGVYDEPGAVSTQRMSVDSLGNEVMAPSTHSISVSDDGRFYLFQSGATNLDLSLDDENGTVDVFVHDRLTGSTRLISKSAASPRVSGNAVSQHGFISGDGRYVAYQSLASDLVAGDGNYEQDVFVYDRAEDALGVTIPGTGGGDGFTWGGICLRDRVPLFCHSGQDMAGGLPPTPVFAMLGGGVVLQECHRGGYGWHILIDHGELRDGYHLISHYAHVGEGDGSLSPNDCGAPAVLLADLDGDGVQGESFSEVDVGDHVVGGQLIAWQGNSGAATSSNLLLGRRRGVHLHFSMNVLVIPDAADVAAVWDGSKFEGLVDPTLCLGAGPYLGGSQASEETCTPNGLIAASETN
jgi:murein DD-endopeptidase MepM/ murein hydrolase activator NlpD